MGDDRLGSRCTAYGKCEESVGCVFSWSGNTRNLAHQIQELTGGDLFEIETVKAYPEKYRSCTEYAKKEKEADARPALKSKVKDMDAYDVVYVGFPNWWGTAPMAIWSFWRGMT